MAITSTELTSTNPTTVFTAGAQTVISTVYLCNYTAGNVTVDVHAIAGNSAAVGNSNALYSDYLVGANDTWVLDTEKIILDSTDVLVVACSNSSAVTVTVSSYSI